MSFVDIHMMLLGYEQSWYRRQALGFQQFAAAKRHIVTRRARDDIENDVSQNPDNEAQSQGGDQASSSNSASAADDVQLPSNKRLQALAHWFPSTSPLVKVARSPAVQVHRTPAGLVHNAAVLNRPRTAPAAIQETPFAGNRRFERARSDSWETPPSVVPDSQPSNASLKRAFAEAWSSSFTEDHLSSPIAKRQHMAESDDHQAEEEASDMVPGTSSERSKSAPAELPPATQKPVEAATSEIGSSQVPPVLPVSSGQQPHPAESDDFSYQPNRHGAAEIYSQRSSEKSLNFPIPSTPAQPIPTQPDAPAEYEEIWSQIRPPPPPTSEAEFTTHVTPSLRIITEKLPLEKAFKPKTQTRDLRTLERGYWKFCIPQSWPRELRSKFWKFLEDLIGRGKAGWGIRVERLVIAVRDTQENEEESIDSVGPNTGAIKEEVSVFCWGEVVGEIWLVLWLASDRKLRGLGSEWVDAGGDTIITME